MKLNNNKTTSDEQFYRSYEIQLLNQIGYINYELRNSQNMKEWHLNQRNILQKRLNYVQNKIEKEYARRIKALDKMESIRKNKKKAGHIYVKPVIL